MASLPGGEYVEPAKRLTTSYIPRTVPFQAAVITEASAVGRSNREYFRDTWNFLDVPALFLLAAGFLIRLANASDSDDSEQVGEALYLLAAPLLFSRILFYFQIHPSQGALIQVRPLPKV